MPPVGFEPTYREDQYDYLLKRVCFTDKCRYVGKFGILVVPTDSVINRPVFFLKYVGPERLELPVRDAADLQSAPMPSPVTTPRKVEIRTWNFHEPAKHFYS